MSLQARLLAGLAAIAMVLVVVSAVVTTTTQNQLIRQVDTDLTAANQGPRGPNGQSDRIFQPPPLGQNDEDQPRQERPSDFYVGLVDANGALITYNLPNVQAASLGAPVLTAAMLDGHPGVGSVWLFTADSTSGQGQYRVAARRLGDGVGITARSLTAVTRTVHRLILVELFGLLAVLVVLSAVAWWVIRLGIRPIKQMTATASEIAATGSSDLAVRVPETSDHTESGRLAVALNAMLGRIESAVGERARSEDRLRRFVADASHELRTPLTTIRGYAELYRLGGLDVRNELDDAMRRTEQEAQRMGRLVEDMLTLAKLDQHRPLDQRPVDVADLVSDAGRDAAVVSPGRHISMDLDHGADLVVVGDVDRLRQVLANVVGNALVHTPPTSAVTLRATRTGGQVVLEVVDKGPGMPPEVAARVTERFYRADPARARNNGGSGLGMAIVDGIATAHGGSVALDTSPERGTTVRITLPATTSGELPATLAPAASETIHG